MQKLGYVYMIKSPTNQIYVGSTLNLSKRKYYYEHLHCKNQIKLYRSLLKYGFCNHIFTKIWEGNIEEMFYMENFFGKQYNVLDRIKGLNLKLPKLSDKHKCFSEETINKMKISQKKRFIEKGYAILFTKEVKDKISKKLTGRKQSDIHIATRMKLFHKPVICTKTGKEFISIKEAAEFYGICRQYLGDMLRGKSKNNTTLIKM